ncbi:P-loop containing nucleoside triphosphate hydrolase protein [Lentinus tigrinus ALCF2SS1-7]|uniref:RNA helicase n=1 Tax=Lentinus tigrinus ALCF2SS1-6 TaxID=1328759 RepID=A0A5C2SLR9_9APHY|nr:P-loop containing nucleoside triphosphate hydrolase protein [Lentinus tigrinus ALCF2SS1-6]RPD82808.1 P-loop containing nucleoside triphosphate hydrolase protein [Lentinus tigrinus ALCF2SS1-7]
MPPKRGIVKSGNAGNSSKPSKLPPPAANATEEKPLFPPGSKYPLSLLHERCQKNGWEKPVVDTRRLGNGYSFIVTLSRLNKKSSERESVRLEPHPPYVMPSALEARHWGATYALYRFSNGIQLNRVLPPGPREYWNQLAAEHKAAPAHQSWMYEADPFAARKAVEERQDKAAKKKEEASRPEIASREVKQSSEFAHSPEAKMATSLRDFVERAIKQAIEMYPEAGDSEPAHLATEDHPRLMKDLERLGFSATQARSAVTALSRPAPLTTSLLGRLPPLQACIEFLILQVPECDLPQRFLPTVNSSNPFVTSAHAGTDDLKKRWVEDKAVKECGWPAHVVKECMSEPELAEDWGKLVFALDCRLAGIEWTEASAVEAGDPEVIDEDEVEAFGGKRGLNNELVIPLPVAPLSLHIIVPEDRTIPASDTHPPMYLTSPSVAAYVRLHIVSKLIVAFRSGTLREPGESVVMAMIRIIEEEWVVIQDNGPPSISDVLHYLLPQAQPTPSQEPGVARSTDTPAGSKKRKRALRRDDRTDSTVKDEFEQLTRRTEYGKMLQSRQKLPAFASRDQFLDVLKSNRCVIVVGETGCGKTTQLPQFVLDQLIATSQGAKASIIVTQPRRLSAIGVAARVSAERLEDGSVGYAIRGESKQGPRTKILFCTTGVVLRRLGSGDKLSDVTHVIVDEVHERSVDGDFLLLELRELLKTHRDLKVILMSATINHEIFVKYFNNAPLLTIPGFTHPVQDLYLEDFLPKLSYRPSGYKSSKKARGDEDSTQQELSTTGLDEDCQAAIRTIMRSDSFDYDLITATVKHIIATAQKRGAILIFLSGVQEIRQCMERLRGVPNSQVFPLHANLTSDEQRRVFATISEWKVIVSTNVAETSITIDDVIYVIDGGKVKETHYDADAGLTKLTEQWVTRAAAKQRRGRAGRTQPGVCYKLYTRAQETRMAAFPIPEIKRVPLESIALTLKVVHNDVKSFLSRAIDPPDVSAVDKALAVLEELAAIQPDGELTALGRHMAMLPMDLRLGKMLVLGTVFRCLGPVLTIAACLSCKPLFLNPMDKRDEASQARARFATGNSDLLTDVKAYDECARLRTEGKSASAIRAFCEQNFISVSTIRDITSLRLDFLASLSALDFVPESSKPTDEALNANSSNLNLVKAVILGGFWPRVARVHLPQSAIKFDRVQAGTIQRENTAKEFKMYDLKEGRVFVHPASILFNATAWKSPFLTYFQKQMTSKVFLRDATEVPIYALLLFGGPVTVNHIGGGLTVGNKDCIIKLKAWPRIGVLVNQLRRLLDVQLSQCIEEGMISDVGSGNNPVLEAMQALLTGDGLST